jgi:hypothetical protein
MDMEIEKNDIDLTKLFVWEKEVEILNPQGEAVKTVYMRLVGDKDLNRARVFSLRQSAELRELLMTEGSDEHEAFIAGIDYTEMENVRAGVKLLMLQDMVDVARRNVIVKYPKEPASDAPLAEHEAYQKAVDEFPKTWDADVEKEIDKLMKKEDRRLKKLEDDEMKKEYVTLMVNYVCQQEVNRRFMDMCVYYATYKTKEYKKLAFKSFDEYDNVATELKEQLRTAYEGFDLGMGELKKLQEATP